MDVLSRDPAPARATRAAAIAVALCAAGCVVFDALSGDPPRGGSDFPHRVHVVDEGLACSDCHPGAEDGDEAGLPTRAMCMLCHEATEEERPPEKRIERFFADGKLIAARVSALPEETIFTHAKHAAAGLSCADCHGEVGESERIEPGRPLLMDDCTGCHAQRSVSNECAVCHSAIGPDWRPENHEHAWMEVHGQAVRASRGGTVDRCELCHQESSCTTCHQVMPPTNHTEFWRRRGHPAQAMMDRQNCAVCHRSDFCDRCHRESIPLSHAGSFGSPVNTHCYSCHLPLQDNGCVVCHLGTPSHLLAAPKPPDHFPGMDCRQCHGVQVQLPHVDNGDDCNICHR